MRKAQAALAELCKIYWRPVFAFICRQGHSVPDAQDLTQEFFARVVKGRLLQSADRSKGRFRSLLLKALQRFLQDEVDKRLRANVAATCVSFPGMIGWPRRHRTCRFHSGNLTTGRQKEFSTCAGRRQWSSAPCADWATSVKSAADGASLMS